MKNSDTRTPCAKHPNTFAGSLPSAKPAVKAASPQAEPTILSMLQQMAELLVVVMDRQAAKEAKEAQDSPPPVPGTPKPASAGAQPGTENKGTKWVTIGSLYIDIAQPVYPQAVSTERKAAQFLKSIYQQKILMFMPFNGEEKKRGEVTAIDRVKWFQQKGYYFEAVENTEETRVEEKKKYPYILVCPELNAMYKLSVVINKALKDAWKHDLEWKTDHWPLLMNWLQRMKEKHPKYYHRISEFVAAVQSGAVILDKVLNVLGVFMREAEDKEVKRMRQKQRMIMQDELTALFLAYVR